MKIYNRCVSRNLYEIILVRSFLASLSTTFMRGVDRHFSIPSISFNSQFIVSKFVKIKMVGTNFKSVELHVYGHIPSNYYWIWDDFEINPSSPDIKMLRDFVLLKCGVERRCWQHGREQWEWMNSEMDIYGYGMILGLC
jgi:hypothetical protein